jgi:hypothetical protein
MNRSILALVVIPLLVGVGGLFRFSDNVRTVDAVGLSGSGFSLGVGFTLLVLGLAGRIKTTEDKKPPEKQPPSPEKKP